MHVERLDIFGFKSFANKTSLPFPKGITAIVGPNGSGKSNISDAIRWVLGEQSVKMLRGKQTSDVIFSGSEKKGRLGFCEVSLLFDNTDGQMPIDYSHVSISRKLYRNGESEYLVNNSKTTLQEIQYLLAKAHIGQRSYSVIGQGLIDQFLLSTPRERKSFFEEASGIKPFQIKRQQSLNKLQKSLEHLQQAHMIISELAPRLSTLTRQVNKLEQRQELEEKLKTLQYQYYGALLLQAQSEFDQVAEKEKQAKQANDAAQMTVSEITKNLQGIETQEETSEMVEHLQKQYEMLMGEKMKKQQSLMTVQHKITVAKQTPLPLKSQGPSYHQLLNEVKALIKESQTIQTQMEEVSDFSKLKSVFSSLIQKIGKLKDMVLPNEQKIETPKVPQELLDQEQRVKDEIESIAQEISQTQQFMHDEHQRTKQQRKELIDMQHQFQKAQQKLNETTSQLNSVQIQKARIETKLDDLRKTITQEMGEIPHFDKSKLNLATSSQSLYESIQKVKRQLDIIGGIDPETVKEYEETKERHDFLENQISDLTKSVTSLEQVIKELDQQIKEQFSSSFETINKEFDRYFKILFSGGKASLKILYPSDQTSDEDDDEEKEEGLFKRLQTSIKEHEIDGVEIEARPPGKHITNIQMLSGGERALTSIALICAIVSCNPSPFVVLDEVDAALDESNSTKFAHIVDELSSKTQFIVITHNRSSMEKANVLYGVTMGDDGISRLVSLSFDEAQKSIAANRA